MVNVPKQRLPEFRNGSLGQSKLFNSTLCPAAEQQKLLSTEPELSNIKTKYLILPVALNFTNLYIFLFIEIK